MLTTAAVLLPVYRGLSQVPKAPQSVAIFLYNNVELLDFAGPGEVFSAAGFNVFTMSVDGNEILSQGFVSVKPQYSIDNAPIADIIVFPGGGAGSVANNPKAIEWIKKRKKEETFFMSVCTGAEILAKADMLHGLNVTTWHGFIPALQTMLPTSHVLENTRFVDNGPLITTAGVSAGIDGALHLVSRLKGVNAAKDVAFYMEYDKWDPNYGRIDKKNEYLQQLQRQAEILTSGQNPENKIAVTGNSLPTGPLPYEGEFINLALELNEKNQYPQSLHILESALKYYPTSSGLYSMLSAVYKKLGKAVPTDETTFIQLLKDKKIEEASLVLEKDQKAFPSWKLYSEDKLLSVAYHFLHTKDYESAIKIMKLNLKHYQDSWNAFDSLGEAYSFAGNNKEATIHLKKSLELNPENEHAKKLLAKVDGK